MEAHAQPVEQLLAELHTSSSGLSSLEADNRLTTYGQNVLPHTATEVSHLKIFFSQWKSPLVIILFVAGTVSGAVGHLSDMAIIFGTILVNTIVGFVQEDKANRALQTLSGMIEHKAVVSRDGERVSIPSEKIVPGDIIHIEAGDNVPADGRIIHEIECEVNEATLTGESMPAQKTSRIVVPDASLGDRVNMVYRGTTVTNGKAEVVVTATGAHTEIGKIADLVNKTPDTDTPLQRELARLAKHIGVIIIIIIAGMLVIGLVGTTGHYTILELFQTAVAVAVAAIPEGLTISLTVILAIGMQSILARHGLVRRLVSAETLGSISVICTDKTGTLTEGIMQVTQLVTMSESIDHNAFASLRTNTSETHQDALLALRVAVSANNAAIAHTDAPETSWTFAGDTTEIALIKAGLTVGLGKHHLDAAIPRLDEIPFTSERKYMATLHRVDHETLIYVKGAPEVILRRSTDYEYHGSRTSMTAEQQQFFATKAKAMAESGLRVLAVAYKTGSNLTREITDDDVTHLSFIGLIGLSDPIRSDVPRTIATCRDAHIRVIMMTGDHADTARGIGKSIGLDTSDQAVIHGETLNTLSEAELEQKLKTATIFARINPSDKIRIVLALKRMGEVVAVTGDGVNDAPAIKGANIGIAVGSGTDVAKETADLILLDDRFSTIVSAIEEGRRMYHNIKKVILYLFAGSFAEIILIVGSILAKLPLPVLPVQILWVNIIQETFPTIALAFDHGEKENMTELPRKHARQLIDSEMRLMIIAVSIIGNGLLLALFVVMYSMTHDLDLSRTCMFAGLAIASLFYIYTIRSQRYHLWQHNPFDNWHLNAAVIFGLVLLMTAIYTPPLQALLHTVPLDGNIWVLLLVFGCIHVIIIEGIKYIFAERHV